MMHQCLVEFSFPFRVPAELLAHPACLPLLQLVTSELAPDLRDYFCLILPVAAAIINEQAHSGGVGCIHQILQCIFSLKIQHIHFKYRLQMSMREGMCRSLGEILDAGLAHLEALIEVIGPHFLLKHDDGLHELIKCLMKLLPRVAEQEVWQFEPNFQYWVVFEEFRGDLSERLVVAYALFEEGVYFFLVVVDVVDSEYLAVSVAAEQAEVLVCLVDKVLVDPAHYGGAVTLLRQLDVALHLLNDLHHVDLFGGDDVADVGIDNCVLLKDFLALEIDGLKSLVLRILVQCFEAHVFAVVTDVTVLADDHTLAGFLLVDVDFVVVEIFLSVLFQLEEEGWVGGSDVEDVSGIGALLAGGRCFPVDEVEVIEKGDVLEGLADGTLEF